MADLDQLDFDSAADELYAAAPEDFLATRARLVAQARKAGDTALAADVAKLRKPTVAAWIVNSLVLDDPSLVDELSELGDQLRAAQEALAADQLRHLSTQRRQLVAKLSKDAFRRAGRPDPPTGMRDEVTATFDAALADPDVAARLGRLARSEQWSGFGFAATGAPELTLVRGGRDAPAKAAKKRPAKPEPPKPSPAERRRQERAVAKARQELEKAESAYEGATAAEKDLSQRVRKLTGKLSKLQAELDRTRDELETARRDVTTTKAARRQARTELDKAERG